MARKRDNINSNGIVHHCFRSDFSEKRIETLTLQSNEVVQIYAKDIVFENRNMNGRYL
jgi:hypothetical protein